MIIPIYAELLTKYKPIYDKKETLQKGGIEGTYLLHSAIERPPTDGLQMVTIRTIMGRAV